MINFLFWYDNPFMYNRDGFIWAVFLISKFIKHKQDEVSSNKFQRNVANKWSEDISFENINQLL